MASDRRYTIKKQSREDHFLCGSLASAVVEALGLGMSIEGIAELCEMDAGESLFTMAGDGLVITVNRLA